MASMQDMDFAFLILTCVTGFGHFVLCVRDIRHRLRHTRLLARKGISQDDVFNRRVREETSERCERQTKSFAEVTGNLSIIIAVAYPIYYVSNMPFPWNSRQQVCVFLLLWMQLLPRVFPNKFKGAMVDAFFGAHLLILILFIGLSSSTAVRSILQVTASLRCIYSTAFRDARAAIFWNVVFSVVQVCAVTLIADKPGALVYVLLQEGLVIAIVLVLSSMCNKTHERESAGILHSIILRAQVSAFKNLLELVCDCVVELDTDHCLLEDSLKLSAMLGISRSQQGTDFTKLMPNESDRQRFLTAVTGSGSETRPDATGAGADAGLATGSHTGALHTTLRGCFDERIQVEIFFCSSTGLDGNRRLYIGVREYSDGQPIRELPARRVPEEAPGRRRVVSKFRGTQVSRQSPDPAPVERSLEHREEQGEEACEAAAPAEEPLPQTTQSVLGSADAVEDDCGSSGQRSPRSQAASSGPASSVGTSASRSRPHPTLPARRPTSQFAVEASILEVTRHWNLNRPKRMCCPYHNSLQAMRSHIKVLAGRQCKPHFRLYDAEQCPHCGIMFEESLGCESICRFCGFEYEVEKACGGGGGGTVAL